MPELARHTRFPDWNCGKPSRLCGFLHQKPSDTSLLTIRSKESTKLKVSRGHYGALIVSQIGGLA